MVQQALQRYFDALAEHYGPAAGDATEHSGRTALENLLNALRPAGVSVTNEPGRQGDKGAPDFKIMRNGRLDPYIMVKAACMSGKDYEGQKMMAAPLHSLRTTDRTLG